MKNIVLEKYINMLVEQKLAKDYYILYHSTDSSFFDSFNYNNSKKGQRYFNPLGNGLYCSTNKEFSKTFGKNTYYYLLPKTAKIKKITYRYWTTITYQSILIQVLKKYGIDYWNDLSSIQKRDLNQLSNNAPINSLTNLYDMLSAPDLEYRLPNVQTTIENVVDKLNIKYDAIWYKDTDYYQKADEILIPITSFKKELFLKELPKD